MASTNKALFASQNHGQPTVAATAKPGEFTGKGVVAAKEVRDMTRLTDPSCVNCVDSIFGEMDDPPIGRLNCPRLAGTEVTHPAIPSAMAAPSGLGTLTGKGPRSFAVGATSLCGPPLRDCSDNDSWQYCELLRTAHVPAAAPDNDLKNH